ncbi:hypothetical protein DYB37_005226 [Aphanomyces astaci]|uniref:Uncharacterized protein n=1 Tax=Aphanomyces astaci TaxID=112090 RepID=A0A418DNS3_APHAT|nr:hypothetical protein DYB35_007723 [Aphanomyces astaci]RHZ23559.1 hypothetical protein DYB37_005226 [Aphanomyces astaci]
MNVFRFASKSVSLRCASSHIAKFSTTRLTFPASATPRWAATAAAIKSVPSPPRPQYFPSTALPVDPDSGDAKRVISNEEHIEITWADGHISPFHHIWLRDNCPCEQCRHPIAEERMHDTLSIPLSIKPSKVAINDKYLEVHWNDQLSHTGQRQDVHVSRYPLSFLHEHCYTRQTRLAKPKYDETLWDTAAIKTNMPRTCYDTIMHADDQGLLDWLDMLHAYGFALVDDVPPDGLHDVSERVGPIRNTFWGPTWSVKSEPKPMNLSMTSHTLHPHTDFGWSEAPPGLQFLHCLAFQSPDAVGGESTLVDGYAVAEWLRNKHPDAFDLLSNVSIPHVFSSQDLFFQHKAPILSVDPTTKAVRDVRFNQANRSPLHLPPPLVRPYYEALQLWTQATRADENLVHFRLKEGQLLVFNNRRLLHGRHGYNALRTWRHLKGCYMDLEDYKSRLTMLRRRHANRPFSTERYIRPSGYDAAALDPGYDNYNDQFVTDALANVQHVIASGERYDDGSRLKDVAKARTAAFRNLDEGTKADYVYQCSLYDHDIKVNLVPRLQGMLRKLEGDHIRLGTGAKVDLFEHSLQCATRAFEDGADEEMVVCALLHDVGEMLSPCNHGEIAGAILRPYVSPERYWMLAHHEIFQGYYYFHHVGGDRHRRDAYADHPTYQLTVDFCHKYDQAAFDPSYESRPLHFFEPMMQRVLARKAYWFQPDHPKTGCVTGSSLAA